MRDVFVEIFYFLVEPKDTTMTKNDPKIEKIPFLTILYFFGKKFSTDFAYWNVKNFQQRIQFWPIGFSGR